MRVYRGTVFLFLVFTLRGVLSAQPGTGYLFVSSTPAGAGVFIKGVYAGVTPLLVERGTADSLPVAVSKQFFAPWQTTVRLNAGDTLHVSTILKRLEARLTVTSTDTCGAIYIDGEYAASGAVRNFTVLPGNHEILVRDSLTGRSVRTGLVIGDAQEQAYGADLGYRSFWRLAASMVFPGSAQFADRAYVKGGSIFVLSAAAAVFAVGSANRYADRLDSYNGAVAAYASASTEQDASARRAVMVQRHDDLNPAYRTRTASFVVLGAVYALNILDTILNHMITDDIRFLPEKSDMKFVASARSPSFSLRAEITLR